MNSWLYELLTDLTYFANGLDLPAKVWTVVMFGIACWMVVRIVAARSKGID